MTDNLPDNLTGLDKPGGPFAPDPDERDKELDPWYEDDYEDEDEDD